jgi:two-component system sensor kinase
MKIVVIDDEINVRETLVEILEASGHQVLAAENGNEGLDLGRSTNPDVVVCDVMMPGMSGLEVLQHFRADKDLSQIPFLFLSAKTEGDFIRKAMNLGADDFITKPFKADELLEAISNKVKRFARYKATLADQMEQVTTHFGRYGFHELNTPMNGILGAVDFMLEYDDLIQQSERMDLLSNVQISAMRIKRTYTNLLLYFKVNEGEEVYSFNWTSDLLASTNAVEKRINLLYENRVLPSFCMEPGRLCLHNQALELVLFELVDNAMKFGDVHRPPLVRGNLSADQKFYIVTVQDHGHGMDQKQLAMVGPMVQFNRDKREQQGWGLGLFLTRYLIEKSGGSFSLRSVIGEGTIATANIPRCKL